jgi:hypothetical protein
MKQITLLQEEVEAEVEVEVEVEVGRLVGANYIWPTP